MCVACWVVLREDGRLRHREIFARRGHAPPRPYLEPWWRNVQTSQAAAGRSCHGRGKGGNYGFPHALALWWEGVRYVEVSATKRYNFSCVSCNMRVWNMMFVWCSALVFVGLGPVSSRVVLCNTRCCVRAPVIDSLCCRVKPC